MQDLGEVHFDESEFFNENELFVCQIYILQYFDLSFGYYT